FPSIASRRDGPGNAKTRQAIGRRKPLESQETDSQMARAFRSRAPATRPSWAAASPGADGGKRLPELGAEPLHREAEVREAGGDHRGVVDRHRLEAGEPHD